MACFGSNAIRIKRPVAGVTKTGYLKIYESGFICKGWKPRYFVLFEDSSLIWYSDHNNYHHIGGVKLKMVANYMAVGPMCLHLPNTPKLPKGKTVVHMMGIPNIFKKGTKKDDIKMNWILFDGGDEEMKGWLGAITPTLPPPPPRPEPKHRHHQNGQPQHNGQPQNGQPPPYGFNSNVIHPANGNPAYPTNNGYPPQGGGRVGQAHGGNTTVVVQNGGGRRDSGGRDFATGMLLGGAIGIGGYGPGYGWGYGWGWGPHPYGGYWGGGGFSHGGSMNIENNYYDCDQNDYGYDANDVGDFEAGDDGYGGDFGDGGGCGGGGDGGVCGAGDGGGGGCGGGDGGGGGCGGCGGGCGGCGG